MWLGRVAALILSSIIISCVVPVYEPYASETGQSTKASTPAPSRGGASSKTPSRPVEAQAWITIPVGKQFGSVYVSLILERIQVFENSVTIHFLFRELAGFKYGNVVPAGISGVYIDDYQPVSISGIIPGTRYKLQNHQELWFTISFPRPATRLVLTGVTLNDNQHTLIIGLSEQITTYTVEEFADLLRSKFSGSSWLTPLKNESDSTVVEVYLEYFPEWRSRITDRKLPEVDGTFWVDLSAEISSVPFRPAPFATFYVSRFANVREGPSTSYPIIGNLDAGAEIFAREETDRWYRITSKEIDDGWISKTLVSSVRPDIIIDTSIPEITILSPEFEERPFRTVEASLTIRGRAIDSDGINYVTIGGNETQLTGDGTFLGRIRLRIGRNDIALRAVDINGNVRDTTFIVLRDEFILEDEFSDVDIPLETGNSNPNGIAVVFGIESYQYAPSVSYAYNDADIFREYLISTFGFSRENIYFRTDERATKGEFDKAFSQDGWIASRANRNSDVFIYYAGHGIMDMGTQSSYLIPYDVDPNYASTSYSLDQLLTNLGTIDANSIYVILDACFSGGTREGAPLLADTRPIYIETGDMVVPENVTVFTASSSNEYSSAYSSKLHGLFTYYFLKGLTGEADSNGDEVISIEEMHEYLSDTIPAQARRSDREQTPSLRSGRANRILLRY